MNRITTNTANTEEHYHHHPRSFLGRFSPRLSFLLSSIFTSSTSSSSTAFRSRRPAVTEINVYSNLCQLHLQAIVSRLLVQLHGLKRFSERDWPKTPAYTNDTQTHTPCYVSRCPRTALESTGDATAIDSHCNALASSHLASAEVLKTGQRACATVACPPGLSLSGVIVRRYLSWLRPTVPPLHGRAKSRRDGVVHAAQEQRHHIYPARRC